MKRETVLVVGAGMVGHRFCTRLRELDRQHRFRVVCFGDERHAPYDRVNLAQFYEHGSANALLLAGEHAYAEQSIELRAYFGDPLHTMPAFSGATGVNRLPVSENVASRVICLPIFNHMTDTSISRLIALCSAGSGAS